MGFKPSEKVLVALRGVYNLPFNLDDPVYLILPKSPYSTETEYEFAASEATASSPSI